MVWCKLPLISSIKIEECNYDVICQPFNTCCSSLPAFNNDTAEEASWVNSRTLSLRPILRHPLQGPVNVTASLVASFPLPGGGERPSIDQPVIRQAVWSSRKNSLQKCLLASPEMECSFCSLVGGMSGEGDGSDPLCWHHPLSPALSDSAHLIRWLPRQWRNRDECWLLWGASMTG